MSRSALYVPEPVSAMITMASRMLGHTFSYNYNLRSINIPAGLTSIPNGLCYRCYALESIEIPEHIVQVGDDAFYECFRLKEVKFHTDIHTIRNGSFRYSEYSPITG